MPPFGKPGRALLQGLHQPAHQCQAGNERGNVKVLVKGMGAAAHDAEAVEGRHLVGHQAAIAAAGGGDIYVPTPEEKAAFKEAAAPVYDWFKANVDGGEAIFSALTESVAAAEAELSALREAELN